MPFSGFDTMVLGVQIALLLAVGIQFRGRLHSGEDFVLGRRRLNMPLSAAALALNSVPLWWLMIVIGMAFTSGVAAIWLALALLGGTLIGGWYLAPRLRALTNLQQRGTFSELLIGDAGERIRDLLIRSTILIITLTLVFACVAQLHLAAQFLSTLYKVAPTTVMVGSGSVICIALLLAGVWTTAAIDAWQIVAGLSVFLVAAIALSIGVVTAPEIDRDFFRGDWFADHTGVLTISYTLGIAFVGGEIVGQAPLLMRYMACSNDSEMARARVHATLWALFSLTFALLIGWSARALSGESLPSAAVFIAALSHSLAPQVIAVMLLLVVGATAAATGNGIHAIASHLANDLRRGGTPISLVHCRLALVLTVAMVVVIACNLPIADSQRNFERLLLCWHALGASFGPLLIVRLSGKRVRAGSTLGSIWSGFLLTLVFYLMPDTPGELLERGLPFAAALGIALSGGERRRNPDRADRGERTVHDRLPI